MSRADAQATERHVAAATIVGRAYYHVHGGNGNGNGPANWLGNGSGSSDGGNYAKLNKQCRTKAARHAFHFCRQRTARHTPLARQAAAPGVGNRMMDSRRSVR